MSSPEFPFAAVRPTERTHHGDTFVDDYEWLRDKENPEVIAHLEAENSYTEARTAHLADLRQSPAAATPRHLVWDADAAPPRAVQQGVQALLNTLGPRLVSFACGVAEPPSGAPDGASPPPPRMSAG